MSCIEVAVRVRPVLEREKGTEENIVVTTEENVVSVHETTKKAQGLLKRIHIRRYQFDHCFGQTSTQEDIFNGLSPVLLSGFADNRNGAVIAYGQTGSGKTFTMLGDVTNPGLIPQICKAFLNFEIMTSDNAGFEVSFYEIYNEKVRDLLSQSQAAATNIPTLRVREHPTQGPYIQNLSWRQITSERDVDCILNVGCAARSSGPTAVHHASSRSHAVFAIRHPAVLAQLNFVDLAGSERPHHQATREQIRESAHINKSLATLGSVILALSSKRPQRHIPYRDSTLTWILKDSIGGNSKTIMIGTIAPSVRCRSETLNTLRYAHKARHIVNRSSMFAHDSQMNGDHHRIIDDLRAEIKRLRAIIKASSDPKVVMQDEEDLEHTESADVKRSTISRSVMTSPVANGRVSFTDDDDSSIDLKEALGPPAAFGDSESHTDDNENHMDDDPWFRHRQLMNSLIITPSATAKNDAEARKQGLKQQMSNSMTRAYAQATVDEEDDEDFRDFWTSPRMHPKAQGALKTVESADSVDIAAKALADAVFDHVQAENMDAEKDAVEKPLVKRTNSNLPPILARRLSKEETMSAVAALSQSWNFGENEDSDQEDEMEDGENEKHAFASTMPVTKREYMQEKLKRARERRDEEVAKRLYPAKLASQDRPKFEFLRKSEEASSLRSTPESERKKQVSSQIAQAAASAPFGNSDHLQTADNMNIQADNYDPYFQNVQRWSPESLSHESDPKHRRDDFSNWHTRADGVAQPHSSIQYEPLQDPFSPAFSEPVHIHTVENDQQPVSKEHIDSDLDAFFDTSHARKTFDRNYKYQFDTLESSSTTLNQSSSANSAPHVSLLQQADLEKPEILKLNLASGLDEDDLQNGSKFNGHVDRAKSAKKVVRARAELRRLRRGSGGSTSSDEMKSVNAADFTESPPPENGAKSASIDPIGQKLIIDKNAKKAFEEEEVEDASDWPSYNGDSFESEHEAGKETEDKSNTDLLQSSFFGSRTLSERLQEKNEMESPKADEKVSLSADSLLSELSPADEIIADQEKVEHQRQSIVETNIDLVKIDTSDKNCVASLPFTPDGLSDIAQCTSKIGVENSREATADILIPEIHEEAKIQTYNNFVKSLNNSWNSRGEMEPDMHPAETVEEEIEVEISDQAEEDASPDAPLVLGNPLSLRMQTDNLHDSPDLEDSLSNSDYLLKLLNTHYAKQNTKSQEVVDPDDLLTHEEIESPENDEFDSDDEFSATPRVNVIERHQVEKVKVHIPVPVSDHLAGMDSENAHAVLQNDNQAEARPLKPDGLVLQTAHASTAVLSPEAELEELTETHPLWYAVAFTSTGQDKQNSPVQSHWSTLFSQKELEHAQQVMDSSQQAQAPPDFLYSIEEEDEEHLSNSHRKPYVPPLQLHADDENVQTLHLQNDGLGPYEFAQHPNMNYLETPLHKKVVQSGHAPLAKSEESDVSDGNISDSAPFGTSSAQILPTAASPDLDIHDAEQMASPARSDESDFLQTSLDRSGNVLKDLQPSVNQLMDSFSSAHSAQDAALTEKPPAPASAKNSHSANSAQLQDEKQDLLELSNEFMIASPSREAYIMNLGGSGLQDGMLENEAMYQVLQKPDEVIHASTLFLEPDGLREHSELAPTSHLTNAFEPMKIVTNDTWWRQGESSNDTPVTDATRSHEAERIQKQKENFFEIHDNHAMPEAGLKTTMHLPAEDHEAIQEIDVTQDSLHDQIEKLHEEKADWPANLQDSVTKTSFPAASSEDTDAPLTGQSLDDSQTLYTFDEMLKYCLPSSQNWWSPEHEKKANSEKPSDASPENQPCKESSPENVQLAKTVLSLKRLSSGLQEDDNDDYKHEFISVIKQNANWWQPKSQETLEDFSNTATEIDNSRHDFFERTHEQRDFSIEKVRQSTSAEDTQNGKAETDESNHEMHHFTMEDFKIAMQNLQSQKTEWPSPIKAANQHPQNAAVDSQDNAGSANINSTFDSALEITRNWVDTSANATGADSSFEEAISPKAVPIKVLEPVSPKRNGLKYSVKNQSIEEFNATSPEECTHEKFFEHDSGIVDNSDLVPEATVEQKLLDLKPDIIRPTAPPLVAPMRMYGNLSEDEDDEDEHIERFDASSTASAAQVGHGSAALDTTVQASTPAQANQVAPLCFSGTPITGGTERYKKGYSVDTEGQKAHTDPQLVRSNSIGSHRYSSILGNFEDVLNVTLVDGVPHVSMTTKMQADRQRKQSDVDSDDRMDNGHAQMDNDEEDDAIWKEKPMFSIVKDDVEEVDTDEDIAEIESMQLPPADSTRTCATDDRERQNFMFAATRPSANTEDDEDGTDIDDLLLEEEQVDDTKAKSCRLQSADYTYADYEDDADVKAYTINLNSDDDESDQEAGDSQVEPVPHPDYGFDESDPMGSSDDHDWQSKKCVSWSDYNRGNSLEQGPTFKRGLASLKPIIKSKSLPLTSETNAATDTPLARPPRPTSLFHKSLRLQDSIVVTGKRLANADHSPKKSICDAAVQTDTPIQVKPLVSNTVTSPFPEEPRLSDFASARTGGTSSPTPVESLEDVHSYNSRVLLSDLMALVHERDTVADALEVFANSSASPTLQTLASYHSKCYINDYAYKLDKTKSELDVRIDQLVQRLKAEYLSGKMSESLGWLFTKPSDQLTFKYKPSKEVDFSVAKPAAFSAASLFPVSASYDALTMARDLSVGVGVGIGVSVRDISANALVPSRVHAGAYALNVQTLPCAKLHLSALDYREKLVELRKTLVRTCADLATTYADSLIADAFHPSGTHEAKRENISFYEDLFADTGRVAGPAWPRDVYRAVDADGYRNHRKINSSTPMEDATSAGSLLAEMQKLRKVSREAIDSGKDALRIGSNFSQRTNVTGKSSTSFNVPTSTKRPTSMTAPESKIDAEIARLLRTYRRKLVNGDQPSFQL